MRVALSPEQAAFREEARRYFSGLLTPQIREAQLRYELDTATYRALLRQIGADGWLCVSWPPEYGGRGLSEVEEFLLFDEAQRLGVPIPFLTTNTVGPTLLRFGSEEQKARFLPAIVRGEVLFSIGYSEPEAGTDLASLRTRAVREGDAWVITGQKQWTSLVHHADYVWLACRTDPDAPKHRGISILIVPTDAPGFSWTRVDTMGGGLTSATFYDQVRVPLANLVGEEHGGWRLMTAQLNQERVALASSGALERRLTETLRWAQETKLPDGRRVADAEWVRLGLARVRAQLEVLRLQNWKVAWGAASGRLQPADASAMKVYGSQLFVEATRTLQEIVGAHATVVAGAPGAVAGGDLAQTAPSSVGSGLPPGRSSVPLAGDLEVAMRAAPILTFGGGTNEIQRDLIATAGLGLPRGGR